MKKRIALAAAAVAFLGWLLVLRHPLQQPSAYTKGTELYYLAWVDHGRYWQKAAAAKKLVELEGKKEYEVTERLWWRQRGLVKNMLTLCLFDMRPTVHKKDVLRLVTLKDREFRTEGAWMKTDYEFDGEGVDFFFDWGGEAALRLARQGYADLPILNVIMGYACSFYPTERKKAKAVFDTFQGLPPYDPSPQPKTINEVPQKTQEQVGAIRTWLQDHFDTLEWSQEKRQYQ